jgi:hypothetical protein
LHLQKNLEIPSLKERKKRKQEEEEEEGRRT